MCFLANGLYRLVGSCVFWCMVSTDSLDLVLSWGGSPHSLNMPPASAASPVTSCRRSLRRGTLSAPRSPWHFASAIFCRGTLPRNPGAHTCTRQHLPPSLLTSSLPPLPMIRSIRLRYSYESACIFAADWCIECAKASRRFCFCVCPLRGCLPSSCVSKPRHLSIHTIRPNVFG